MQGGQGSQWEQEALGCGRLRPSAAEVLLAPFPTRIHFTSASFAEPTIVDVDPRTVDDRVIDVVLR